MNFKETSSLLSCVLGLKRQVVAIDLAEDEAAFVDWPIPAIKHRLTFCMMVGLASLGYRRKALEEHFRWWGSAETFRFIDHGEQAHTTASAAFGHSYLNTLRAVLPWLILAVGSLGVISPHYRRGFLASFIPGYNSRQLLTPVCSGRIKKGEILHD